MVAPPEGSAAFLGGAGTPGF